MKKILTFTYISAVFASLWPISAAADDGYQMLAPITYLQSSDGLAHISTFIPGVIKLMIGISAALAVIYIIFGGIQYMSTDAVGGKKDGKKTIQNAILGLLLVIGSYSILYTLNPKLVNFNLEIPGVAGTSNTDGTSDIGIPDGSQGITTASTECGNCSPIGADVVPQKGVAPQGTTNGACAYPGPCRVNILLAHKLVNLTAILNIDGISKSKWWVTEMYPPTVHHADPCHQNGTCVDATFITKPPKNADLLIFMQAINDIVGPNFIYEVCNDRLSKLIKEPSLAKFKSKFQCPSTTTGESFHIGL